MIVASFTLLGSHDRGLIYSTGKPRPWPHLLYWEATTVASFTLLGSHDHGLIYSTGKPRSWPHLLYWEATTVASFTLLGSHDRGLIYSTGKPRPWPHALKGLIKHHMFRTSKIVDTDRCPCGAPKQTTSNILQSHSIYNHFRDRVWLKTIMDILKL